jgi:uncharacterized protein (DUF952 family)
VTLIYKILSQAEYDQAAQAGKFVGSAVDVADGFIHFSDASQAQETARRHFFGQSDLVLVAVEADKLGSLLRWEPSRGGELFPHLFNDLEFKWMGPPLRITLDEDGIPDVTGLLP